MMISIRFAASRAYAGRSCVCLGVKRGLSWTSNLGYSHDNPLGLPKSNAPPRIPRRGNPMDNKKRKLRNVDRIIAVSSAKGGVGKSTVAVNVALALSRLGNRVGVLDMDIFGPSIPTLMNVNEEPALTEQNQLIPLSNYGIKIMSMGFLIPESNPVAWRGLMVIKAVQQLLFDVDWTSGSPNSQINGLDYLVMDLPPGTGDTQLTIGQMVDVDGAVIVSTPQDLALVDTQRGMSLFEKVNIPILGIVKNMDFFICPQCHHETQIFESSSSYAESVFNKYSLLGSVPLDPAICKTSDKGLPAILADPKSTYAHRFIDIAKNIIARLDDKK